MPETAAPAAPASPETPREEMPAMSFLEHLEELRRRIFRALVGVGLGFGVGWWYHEQIYRIMEHPIVQVLRKYKMDEKLVYTHPVDPFDIYMKVALVAGLFLASPWVLYQVWAFVAPGLYRNEKRYILPFLLSTVLLFVTGGLFGYFLVYPAALDFLIGNMGADFKAMITVKEYTSLFLSIIIGMGIIFEMPILAFFLGLMGVVSPGWMWRNFRYAILGIFIVAAIVTPTPDVINMCIFAAPMLALYVVSIAVVWAVHPRQRRRRAEAKAAAADKAES